MQKINQEKVLVAKAIEDFDGLLTRSEDSGALLELIVESEDEAMFQELKSETRTMLATIRDLEVKSLLSGRMDPNSAYLSINAGAGGTEAQDWAEILLRMYTRYAERQGFRC